MVFVNTYIINDSTKLLQLALATNLQVNTDLLVYKHGPLVIDHSGVIQSFACQPKNAIVVTVYTNGTYVYLRFVNTILVLSRYTPNGASFRVATKNNAKNKL